MIKLEKNRTYKEWNGFNLKEGFGMEQIPKRGNMWQHPDGKPSDVWQFTISAEIVGN